MIICNRCGGRHELVVSFESIFANHFDFDPYQQEVSYDCPRKGETDPTQIIELTFTSIENPEKDEASVDEIIDYPDSLPEKK